MRRALKAFRIALEAFYRFLADDGWAIASHIALSALMALFPFLIVITALAGMFGSRHLADQAAELLLETWPSQVADPLSGEIHNVLTQPHGGVLTLGAVFALYFASNGIESLRVGLNRAYGVVEQRSWYLLRLESIGYTMVAAVTALAMAFLIVLGPLLIATARRYVPLLVAPNEDLLTVLRYGVTVFALTVALIILHKWLPAGTRRLRDIWPGIVVTMLGSLAAGVVFGKYLERFASNYVTTYAGLASVMIALVFLYFIATIFVYGGELNAAILRARHQLADAAAASAASPQSAPPPAHAD